MPNDFNCPTRQDLANLLTGRLPDHALGSVESHVLTCTLCQTVLDELDPDDRLY